MQGMSLAGSQCYQVCEDQSSLMIMLKSGTSNFKYQAFQVCFDLLLQNSREVKQPFGDKFGM